MICLELYEVFLYFADDPSGIVNWEVVFFRFRCVYELLSHDVEITQMPQSAVLYCSEHLNNTLIAVSSFYVTVKNK